MPKTKPNVFDGQNITASEFFKTHWQRLPYFFTNTSIDLSCLPSVEQMFELASKEDVQSRIVYSEDDIHYQAIYDEPEAWQQVQSLKPTLLVSDIEKWYPQAMGIMAWFPFIKNWRFDDVMMSFAPKGASVGAHTDHYDVFLIQVQGTRQWSFDDQPLPDCEMVDDSELAVIAGYQPQHTHELKPGDVLYLPPEIPHHGISTSDDCVTCSIGLRAPSDAELLTAVMDLIVQENSATERFKDGVSQLYADASVGGHEISYLRKHLIAMSQINDAVLADLFGQVVTNYRVFDDVHSIDNLVTSAETGLWQKSPFAVFAYHNSDRSLASLMVNGECYLTSSYTAELICNQPKFSLQDMQKHSPMPATDTNVIDELIDLNHLIPA